MMKKFKLYLLSFLFVFSCDVSQAFPGTGVQSPGLIPIANNKVLGNSSGSTAMPAAISVPLAALATQAADTFIANGTAGAAAPTAMPLAASQFVCRGPAGDIVACS